MTSSSWQILTICGALSIALVVDARTPDRATASAPDTPGVAVGPKSPGLVVLHFGPALRSSAPGEAARPCQQGAKSAGRVRTLFREYRTPSGDRLTINGHVALRFKPSTSDAQIDSLIGAIGVEVFTPVNPTACRRYVFKVARPDEDPAAIANALRASGLVEYAIPDQSAGRSEGVPGDSFFVDQLALSKSIANDGVVVADTVPSKYGMGQVLSQYVGPAMKLTRAEMSAALFSENASMSALQLVKANGLTTLHVEVPDRPASASVNIVLYSLSGTPVRHLVSETLDAGNYLVGWDGNDDGGRRVQPGVYVAVMTAGSFRETRRLVVR